MATIARPLDRYFANYSGDHRHRINQTIHLLAVPAILWSVVALLWCLPIGGGTLRSGVCAALAMFVVWMFYYRLSRPLAWGMLATFFFCGCLCRLLETRIGLTGLAVCALTVFVLAWIAQFVGHHLEGHRPSFITDLVYLLIGPLWVLAKLYQRCDWRY